MADKSPPSEERQWQLDARTFVREILWNWHTWLGTVGGLGVIFVLAMLKLDIPLWAVPWIMVVGLVWGGFDAWTRERRRKEQALVVLKEAQKKLHEIEIERITLLLEFTIIGQMDYQIYARLFKLRITNLHASKTAKGVCAFLEKVESTHRASWTEPMELAMAKFPLPLPVTPIQYVIDGQYPYKCDINPGDHVDFDLCYTQVEMAVKWMIGLPPFNCKKINGMLVKSDCEFPYGNVLSENKPLAFSVYVSAIDVPKLSGYDVLNFSFGDSQASNAWFSGASIAHQHHYTPFVSSE